MLRFSVILGLDWPVRIVNTFYREICSPHRQVHADFIAQLSEALEEQNQTNSATETVLEVGVARGRYGVVEALVNLMLQCGIDQSARARCLHSAIRSGYYDIAKFLVTSFPKMVVHLVDNKSVLETLEESSNPINKALLQDFLVKRIYHIEGRPLHVKRLLHGPLGTVMVSQLEIYLADKSIQETGC
jgi:hypothetical protein